MWAQHHSVQTDSKMNVIRKKFKKKKKNYLYCVDYMPFVQINFL